MSALPLYEVFKARGVPTLTYIRRKGGSDEKDLNEGLDRRGNVCLITGPSKTGKTTLFTNVLKERQASVVQIRGNGRMSAEDLWSLALEKLGAERVAATETGTARETRGDAEISGQVLGIGGKSSVGLSSTQDSKEVRQRTLAKASPDHLVPFLRDENKVLVLEDFHYLSPVVRQSVFQDWKAFCDNEVSVIVVGTTHRAGDLAEANPDLAGRISHLRLGSWHREDLCEIARVGFRRLKVQVPKSIVELIGLESFGLPIITQATCLRLMEDRSITATRSAPEKVEISERDLYATFRRVAMDDYDHGFAPLVEKVRQDGRYVCALLTSLFMFFDPPAFSLDETRFHDHYSELPASYKRGLSLADIVKLLPTLGNFQAGLDMDLLDWDDRRRTLYMVQPSLLFYLRWKDPRVKGRPFRLETVEAFLGRQP